MRRLRFYKMSKGFIELHKATQGPMKPLEVLKVIWCACVCRFPLQDAEKVKVKFDIDDSEAGLECLRRALEGFIRPSRAP